MEPEEEPEPEPVPPPQIESVTKTAAAPPPQEERKVIEAKPEGAVPRPSTARPAPPRISSNVRTVEKTQLEAQTPAKYS